MPVLSPEQSSKANGIGDDACLTDAYPLPALGLTWRESDKQPFDTVNNRTATNDAGQ